MKNAKKKIKIKSFIVHNNKATIKNPYVLIYKLIKMECAIKGRTRNFSLKGLRYINTIKKIKFYFNKLNN